MVKESFDRLVDHFLSGGFFLVEAVEVLEKTMIARALERTNGNRLAASKLLGIHRNTLQRKAEQYRIESKGAGRKPALLAKPVRVRPREAG